MKGRKDRKFVSQPEGSTDSNLLTAVREGNVQRVVELLKDKNINVDMKDNLHPNKVRLQSVTNLVRCKTIYTIHFCNYLSRRFYHKMYSKYLKCQRRTLFISVDSVRTGHLSLLFCLNCYFLVITT